MTPRYQINPADRLILGGGQILTCKGLTANGYLLQPFGTDLTDHVSFEEFEEARQHPDFRQDPLFYTESHSRARARTLIEGNDEIPVEEMPDVRWREACVRAFHDEEARDRRNPPPPDKQRVNRTRVGFNEAMRRAGPQLMQLDCAKKATAKKAAAKGAVQKRPSLTKSGKPRKIRAGQTVQFRSLPGAKTLQNWTLAYEEAGCHAGACASATATAATTNPGSPPTSTQ